MIQILVNLQWDYGSSKPYVLDAYVEMHLIQTTNFTNIIAKPSLP